MQPVPLHFIDETIFKLRHVIWGGEGHFGQFKREVMIVEQNDPKG